MQKGPNNKRRIHIETENSDTLPAAEESVVAQNQGAAPPDEDAEMLQPEAEPVDELTALRRELETERDARLRALAEMANYRKRTQEERAQQLQFANEQLLQDLIPVLDHFEMATEHGEANEQTAMLCKGYEMILQQLRDVCATYGMTEIEAMEGMYFDPEQHEAVERIQTQDPCEGTVMKVLRKGYKLRDRVLRPVRVAVAVPPEG